MEKCVQHASQDVKSAQIQLPVKSATKTTNSRKIKHALSHQNANLANTLIQLKINV